MEVFHHFFFWPHKFPITIPLDFAVISIQFIINVCQALNYNHFTRHFPFL